MTTEIDNAELLKKLEKAVDTARYEWVLLRTYSSREKSIKMSIENRLELLGLHDLVDEIIVPEETILQNTDGIKKKITRTRLPGYLLINMDIHNAELVAELRKINGVVNFAGGSYEPIPLERKEVLNILEPIILKAPAEAHATKVSGKAGVSKGVKSSGTTIEFNYVVGDIVTVKEGPFEGMDASVSSIDAEHEHVQVLLSLFGRETPVDLHITQIVKQ